MTNNTKTPIEKKGIIRKKVSSECCVERLIPYHRDKRGNGTLSNDIIIKYCTQFDIARLRCLRFFFSFARLSFVLLLIPISFIYYTTYIRFVYEIR